MKLTQAEIKEIYRFKKLGVKPRAISKILKISESQTEYWCYRDQILAWQNRYAKTVQRSAYAKEYREKYKKKFEKTQRARGYRVVTEEQKAEILRLKGIIPIVEIAARLNLLPGTIYYHINRDHVLAMQRKYSATSIRKRQKRNWHLANKAKKKGTTVGEMEKAKRTEYHRVYQRKLRDKKRGGSVAEVKQKKIELLLKKAKELKLI